MKPSMFTLLSLPPYFGYKLTRLALTLFVLFTGVVHGHTRLIRHTTYKQDDAMGNDIMWAIESNNVSRIIELLRVPSNLNRQDFMGYTPLHYAVKKRNITVVKLLIQAGAFLDAVNKQKQNTPLLLAVGLGYKKIASLLSASGANPHVMNSDGYNALHLCMQYNRKDLAELLLKTGSRCNIPTAEGDSPLILAIKMGSMANIKLLLEQPTIASSQDKEHYSELHWAIRRNSIPIFRLLLKSKKFNPNAQTKQGVTLLHLIVTNPKNNYNFLKELLNVPLLEINAQDITGSTALHYAVATKQFKVVNGLLTHPSIDTNVQNYAGETALHYAVESGYMPIVKKLLACSNTRILVKNKAGVTPIELAIRKKDSQVYKAFINYRDILDIV